MKKLMTYFIVGSISLIALSSCGVSKPVSGSAHTQSQNDGQREVAIPFNMSYLKDYKLSPAQVKLIQFYNSQEITLSNAIYNSDADIQNGRLSISDTSGVQVKKVARMTPGLAFHMEVDKSNRFTGLWVSFSKEDKAYEFFYKLNPNGELILEAGTGGSIVRNGIKYTIYSAGIAGDSKLLFMKEQTKSNWNTSSKAEGNTVN